MTDRTIVALDAMGGDNAPKEMIKGAVQALEKTDAVQVLLVGKEDVIRAELAQYTYDKARIEVVNATEVIETAEPPVNAIRQKEGFFYCGRYESGEGRTRQMPLYLPEVPGLYWLEVR